MPTTKIRPVALLAAVLATVVPARVGAQDTSLTGLWHARRSFGPELRGELVVERQGREWRASIGGRSVPATLRGDSLAADFRGGGTFAGRVARDGALIRGHWIQPRTEILTGRRHATPVVLTSCGEGCWQGMVVPQDDRFTFYLQVRPRADGTPGAFLRNPERNQGRFIRADRILRRRDTVDLRNAADSTIVSGTLQGGVLSFVLRGSIFDFRKLDPDSFTDFYPRGRPTVDYAYAPPRKRDDGWEVARAADVGLSEDALTRMVRTLVNASEDSANAHRVHGILVARDGKLVLEEYFFGEHAGRPHDTRSASKTFLTVVLGAAMQAGLDVGPGTPVYATFGQRAGSLDRRRQALTLRHLLTMSSGLDCDDDGEQRPGNEDLLTEQDTNPDWKGMVLGLDMVRDPGAAAVYCSINPYLAGEVIEAATGRSFLELAWELVGEPLQMERYHMQLTPLVHAYNGGGAAFLPRDFLKLAQLYANGGTWNGRRVVSEAWVRESVEPRYAIGGATPNYGYLWWTTEYLFRGRRIRAYHAAGNGGQLTMFIPELRIAIAVFGGNYAERAGATSLRELIPQVIAALIDRP